MSLIPLIIPAMESPICTENRRPAKIIERFTCIILRENDYKQNLLLTIEGIYIII